MSHNSLDDPAPPMPSEPGKLELVELRRRLAARHPHSAPRIAGDFHHKAGFRPDQPRWPKGTGGDSGRWSGGAGAEGNQGDAGTIDLSAMRRKPRLPELPLHLPHFSSGLGRSSPSRQPITIINNAQTGFSTIDETTEKLRPILENVVNARPEGFGPDYGKAIHYDFAAAVRSGNLRGIGSEGVEQTFGPDPDRRDAPYGTKGSVRTDITLRNDGGDVIAIYDVKTGDATLGPRRVQELRDKTGASRHVPIIEMHIRRGLSVKAAATRHVWIITLRLWNPWVRASRPGGKQVEE